MNIVTDMGAHGAYIWPSYAAFLLIFGALIWWVSASNTKARRALDQLETSRNSAKDTK